MNNFNQTYTVSQLILKWKWVILCALSLLIRMLASFKPEWVESIYSRGIFLFIRWLFDISLAFSPIPLIYFFYAITIFWLIKCLLIFFIKKPKAKLDYMPPRSDLGERIRDGFFALLSFASCLLFFFMILWGFHFARVPFHQQIGITIQPLDSISLKKELETASIEAIKARNEVTLNKIFDTITSPDLESKIRKDVSVLMYNNNFPFHSRLRGRQLKPDGILFRFGISGIYMPFVGESNIDNGIHPFEKPFTMAHEMAHGYGWTDEASANFVAYLSCIGSSDAFTRYSGYLMYYRYVASNYRRFNTEGYKKFRETLPEGFKNDLKAINDRIQSYQTWVDTEGVNNIFLKSQGIKDGTASYSRVVTWVYSWRLKKLGTKN